MTAADLVKGTHEVGISLWVEAGKLRYKSPSKLNERMRETLKQHKCEIISLLSSQPKPYIKNGSELIIPSECHPKYRWWDNGQSIFQTLLELDAPDTLIEQHVGELGSPASWRRWQEILTDRIESRKIGSKSYTELFADLKPEDTP